ncbi:MAG: hypothetical protein IJL92_03155 [Thermoguttaceae bacterium]|nr:hypothetical protein [Thermoguttaceae bacterium]
MIETAMVDGASVPRGKGAGFCWLPMLSHAERLVRILLIMQIKQSDVIL